MLVDHETKIRIHINSILMGHKWSFTWEKVIKKQKQQESSKYVPRGNQRIKVVELVIGKCVYWAGAEMFLFVFVVGWFL